MKNIPFEAACTNYEHKMFKTRRRQEELNYINLKGAFCWLTLHKN